MTTDGAVDDPTEGLGGMDGALVGWDGAVDADPPGTDAVEDWVPMIPAAVGVEVPSVDDGGHGGLTVDDSRLEPVLFKISSKIKNG